MQLINFLGHALSKDFKNATVFDLFPEHAPKEEEPEEAPQRTSFGAMNLFILLKHRQEQERKRKLEEALKRAGKNGGKA